MLIILLFNSLALLTLIITFIGLRRRAQGGKGLTDISLILVRRMQYTKWLSRFVIIGINFLIGVIALILFILKIEIVLINQVFGYLIIFIPMLSILIFSSLDLYYEARLYTLEKNLHGN